MQNIPALSSNFEKASQVTAYLALRLCYYVKGEAKVFTFEPWYRFASRNDAFDNVRFDDTPLKGIKFSLFYRLSTQKRTELILLRKYRHGEISLRSK